ncbi:MAG TPA: metallophosphoesterase [Acidobacteriaceae bacterium]|nr:metallophosphoesterase [Acidobacteriaceae bacterium]
MDVSVEERKIRKGITRRTFLKAAGIAVIGVPLYAAEISRHEISIERHNIRLDRLPDEFRGFRIVHITDFHYAEYTEPYFIRDVVERVNRLNPNLVLFNGDYITEGFFPRQRTNQFAYRCAEILSYVKCPLRYAVLGNHDSTFAMPAVIDAFKVHNIPLLNNAYTPIEQNGARFWLAGTEDAVYKHMDLDKAVPPPSVAGNEPVILMVHEPDVLPQVAHYNVDLMFSGHTHGGQVRFPLLPPFNLPPLGRKYVEGLFRQGRTQLYVNRGVGTVGIPMRFNCPPEIAEITLV